MLRVPMLARLATQLGGRAFPQSRAVVRPTFRALCSAPVDLTMKKEESVFSLESIAEQADYPRVAKEMLKSFPDDFVEEMTKELGSQENPVAGMNELVEMWMDPEASAEELEASTDQLMTDIHADDAQDPEELQAQIDAHVNKVFDQMGIDLEEGIEASDLGEFEEDPTPEASGPDVDDWRRLQDMTKTNRHEASDSDEALSQKHPWFKTRRLELGVKLPTAQLAGSDPLANVFGVSVAAPTFTGQLPKGQREPYFYPGNILEPETLNPPRFDDGKQKFRRYNTSKRIVKKRICPFKTGRVPMPDVRNVGVLSRFVSEGGKILPRRRTGICAKNQRKFAKIVKRSRQFGLIPTTSRMQRPLLTRGN